MCKVLFYFRGTNEDIRIIAVDLQEMAPIPGIHSIKGDITRKETVDLMLKMFKGNKAELVVCDGAPDGFLYNNWNSFRIA